MCKFMKRTLSLLVAMALCLGLLPGIALPALAAETFTVTGISSNEAFGTVAVDGYQITANPAPGYYVAGYFVSAGQATVTLDGNIFTVVPQSDCSLMIFFAAKASITYSIIENNKTVFTGNSYQGEQITLPQHTGQLPAGYVFLGWVTTPVEESAQAPALVYMAGGNYNLANNQTAFYALYAWIDASVSALRYSTTLATEPEATEPEVTEPEATEPEVTEPEVTEPEVTEPEVTEPEVTEPEVTEPEVTEPSTEPTEPEVTEPEVTEPEVTEPSTEPENLPAELVTNIGELNFIVGVPQEFTFSTVANSMAGTMVIGSSNFSDDSAIEKLEYYETANGQWYELSGDFGPATGFPLTDATSTFRVTFAKPGAYTFTASMKDAVNGEIICSVEATAQVHQHTWVEHEAVAPTCFAEGNIAYKQCSECGEAWTMDEDPKPLSKYGWILGPTEAHTFEHHEEIPATCETDGHEAFDYCTTCQCFFYEDPLKLTFQAGVILATGHQWIEYGAVVPSCDMPGCIAYQKCRGCGIAQTGGPNPQPLPDKGWIVPPRHDVEHIEAKAATATAEGCLEHWHCLECNGIWLDAELTQKSDAESVILPKDPNATEPTEPEVTEPSTEPTEPEVTEPSTEPTEPEVTEPSTEPTEPEVTEPSTEPTEPEVTEPSTEPTEPEVTEPSTEPTEPTCVHTWVEYEAVAPTCIAEGNIAYKQCSECGEAWSVEEEPKPLSKYGWILGATGEHTFEHHDAVEATCDTDGHEAFDYCTGCECFFYEDPLKLTFQAGVIPATGHIWVEYAAVEPTCYSGGNIAYRRCSKCGAAQTAGENPIPLSKDGWILSPSNKHTLVHQDKVAATCEVMGHEAFDYCTTCSRFFYEDPEMDSYQAGIIPALGHKWTQVEAVAATCGAAGNIAYQLCENCQTALTTDGKPLEKDAWVLPATGAHSYVEHEAKVPTCTEKGWNAYQTCENCDYTTYQEIAATDHSLVEHEAKAPTCTEIGWNAYQTCENCDYTTYEELAKVDHSYVDHEGKAPTCTEKGWKAYQTCENCDYTTYQEIAATDHTYVDHKAKAATCTEKGWKAYQTCENCDYTTYQEIAPKGHRIQHYDAVEGTCVTDGHEAFDYCESCQSFFYEDPEKDSFQDGVIAAQGHDWKEFEAITPDCETEGRVAYKQCANCAEAWTLDKEPIPLSKDGWVLGPLGHNYVDGVCTNCQAADPESGEKGDLNGDGIVTNADVVTLLWFSLFPEDYPLSEGLNGDLNHDTIVTNADVVTLLWFSLFPEDYPLT